MQCHRPMKILLKKPHLDHVLSGCPYGTCNREQANRIHHHYAVEYQKLCQKFDEEERVGGGEPEFVQNDRLEEEDIELPTGPMVTKWENRGWARQLNVLQNYDQEENSGKRLTAKQWNNLLEWVYQSLLPEKILALQEVFFNARGGKQNQPNWLQRPTTERRLDQIMQRICCLDMFISQREQVTIVAENTPPSKRISLNKQDRTRDTKIQKKVNDELLRIYNNETRTTTTTMMNVRSWLKDGKKWNCFFDDDYLQSCTLAMICLLLTDGKLTFSQIFSLHVWDFFVSNLHHLGPSLMDIAKSFENSIKSFRTSGRIVKPFQYWELMPAVDFHLVNGYKRYVQFGKDMTVEEGIKLIPQFGRKGADFQRYKTLATNERNQIQSVPHHEELEIAVPSQFAVGQRARPVVRTGISPIRASERLKSHRRVNDTYHSNEQAEKSSLGFPVEVRRPIILTEPVEVEEAVMEGYDIQESWMSDGGGATPAYRPDLSMIPSSVVDLNRDVHDVNMPDFLIDDVRHATAVQVPCSDIGDNNSPVEEENESEAVGEGNLGREGDWDSDYLFSITESDMENNF
ncbi:hypothetical protein DFP73DRAFT_528060 [Morchella snyderi]|nr:hypothetical protein DFP73DRAFT_528060 [Morchella snyderi]